MKFATAFQEAIVEFKNKYFEDRKQVLFFTQYMIVIVNHCLQLVELGNQLEKQYITTADYNLSDLFGKLRATYIKLRNESVEYILEELFVDLDQHFDKLFTVQWLTSNVPVDTIYITVEDYYQDYKYLVESNYNYIVQQTRTKVARKYLVSMLSKRTSFKTYDESTKAAKKVIQEAERLKQLFSRVGKDIEGEDPFDAIVMLAEVLKSDDDMLSFELHRVVEKYPDITDDHLLRLLSLRGDLSKSDIKDKILYLDKPKILQKTTIFKTIVFPKLVNINLNF